MSSHNQRTRITPGKKLTIKLRLANESNNVHRLVKIPIRVISYDRVNKKMSAICKSNEALERTYVEILDFFEPNNRIYWQQRANRMDWATYDVRGTRITIHRPFVTGSRSELRPTRGNPESPQQRQDIGIELREQVYLALLIRHGVSLT